MIAGFALPLQGPPQADSVFHLDVEGDDIALRIIITHFAEGLQRSDPEPVFRKMRSVVYGKVRPWTVFCLVGPFFDDASLRLQGAQSVLIGEMVLHPVLLICADGAGRPWNERRKRE